MNEYYFGICFRDLSSNQLNGTIPSGLLKRIQDGSLNLKSLPYPPIYMVLTSMNFSA
jgi:hypothetical protein